VAVTSRSAEGSGNACYAAADFFLCCFSLQGCDGNENVKGCGNGFVMVPQDRDMIFILARRFSGG
jgi:hypothetical protein